MSSPPGRPPRPTRCCSSVAGVGTFTRRSGGSWVRTRSNREFDGAQENASNRRLCRQVRCVLVFSDRRRHMSAAVNSNPSANSRQAGQVAEPTCTVRL